jgi:hypothetical protein
VIEIREIEGIGYHDLNHGGDYLLVERWIKRPEDLKGQSVTIAKLLSPEFRGKSNQTNDPGRNSIRKFRFRISIETTNPE